MLPQLFGEVYHLIADIAQHLLAFDDARVCIGIARHTQPLRTEPNAVAGDHRFAGSQASLNPQSLIQGLRRQHRRQYRGQNSGPLYSRQQRRTAGARLHGARLHGAIFPGVHHREMAALKARQQRCDALQAVHAHRFEIGTEHRFHGALPALLDAQLLRDARHEMQRLRFQPFGDFSR